MKYNLKVVAFINLIFFNALADIFLELPHGGQRLYFEARISLRYWGLFTPCYTKVQLMRSPSLSYRYVSCVMCCEPVSLSGCLVCVHYFIYVLLLFLSVLCLYLELLCSGLVYHGGLINTCSCLYVRSYINSKSVTHLWARAELNLIGNLIVL